MKNDAMQPPKGPLLGIAVEDDGGGEDSSLDAAKDILQAVADKDAKALDMALKRHYELCESDHKDDSDDDEE